MKAYQSFTKSYRLIDSTDKVVGEYTTVDGCKNAARRKGIENYRIEQI